MRTPQSVTSRWGLVSDLFEAAADCAPSDRAALVASRTSDPDIAREVLRLLLLTDEAGDFLETPLLAGPCIPEAPFALHPGEIVAGRFELEAPLGRGGMGEVYSAWDQVLGERVALKLMRPGPGPLDAMLGRFRREVQLARRVSHPGVCRVHDVAFHDGADGRRFVVLTMELLQGETLRERLVRGALEQTEALAIAIELAGALDAAHSTGVLHLDLKPENVFLETKADGSTRAVLTDFGLAHAVDGPRTASEGPRFGTPRYMAPELLGGRPPTVHSDIYALGLVVGEMLGAKEGSRALPPDWQRVLTRATAADPQRRHATAGALVAQLSGESEATERVSARGGAGLIAFTCIVALLLGGLRLSMRTPPLGEGAATLMVMPVRNATGQGEIEGLTEVIRSQLAQSPRLNPAPTARVYEVLRRMRREPELPIPDHVAREVALRQGAPIVVMSTVSKSGSAFKLDIAIERVGRRPSVPVGRWERTFDAADREALFAAAHKASIWIRTVAGERAAEIGEQDRPPAETTTTSWEALKLYAKSEQRKAVDDVAGGILLLEQALRLDPEFAAAHMRRADLLISIGRDVEGYAGWREAIRLTEKRLVTAREHLQIRAQYFEDIGDWVEAEKSYRTYTLHYPHDADAAFRLGSVLASLGRNEEALTWFDQALQHRPGWLVPLVHATTRLIDAGAAGLAAARIAELRRVGEREWAAWLEAVSALGHGDIEGALSRIEPLRTATGVDWRSRGFSLRAAWLLELGQAEQAEQHLLEGLRFDAAQGRLGGRADKVLQLADLYRRQGRLGDSVESALEALEVATGTNRIVASGIMLARAGRPDLARRAAERVTAQPEIPRLTASLNWLLGEIALAEDRRPDATALLTLASAREPVFRSRVRLAVAHSLAGETAEAVRILAEEVERPVRIYRNPDVQAGVLWRDIAAAYAEVIERLDPAAADRHRARFPQLLR